MSLPKGPHHGDEQRDGEKLQAKSDSYGDFWLKGLKEGIYTLLIEKPGYLAQKFGPVDVTKKDINVGDIAL